MARGQSASTGRAARSEIGSPRAGKVPAGLKSIREAAADVPFIGNDGRISPTAIKEGILSIRESIGGAGGTSFTDIMGDIEAELGASGRLLAAGIVTDSVELAYLRRAQEEREAETPIDDIIGGKRSAARVMEQYDKDIADAEARIKEGLEDLAKASPAGKKWAKSLPNEVAKALNTIGEGVAGEKKIAKYDTKGVRVMLNDIYEGLTTSGGRVARSELPAPPRPNSRYRADGSSLKLDAPGVESGPRPRNRDGQPGFEGGPSRNPYSRSDEVDIEETRRRNQRTPTGNEENPNLRTYDGSQPSSRPKFDGTYTRGRKNNRKAGEI